MTNKNLKDLRDAIHKDLKINPARAVKGGKAILDNLCLFKLIQLSDFGLKGEACAYGAIAQSAITLPLYKYLELSGSACKLRNYVILNREHGDVKYCAKAVAVINFVAAIKIILISRPNRLKRWPTPIP